MDSALRPRDIQSRIRHGESPEQVAQVAQVTVEQLMAYAGPVLAEREHVALRAQRSSVRRRQPEQASAARTLGDAVEATLRRLGEQTDSVEWDAWRRDDGRWTLEGVFDGRRRSGFARFTYDGPGNYVTLDNEDARWLVGDLADEPLAATSPEAPRRRLAAVADQLSIDDELGDDALDLVRDAHPSSGARVTERDPAQGQDDDVEERAAVNQRPTAPERATASASKRRGRASVPSWDEIMFGGSSD